MCCLQGSGAEQGEWQVAGGNALSGPEGRAPSPGGEEHELPPWGDEQRQTEQVWMPSCRSVGAGKVSSERKGHRPSVKFWRSQA